MLLSPTVGVERAGKAATTTELSALRGTTITCVTEGRSSGTFEAAPVVALFCRCCDLTFDRQQ